MFFLFFYKMRLLFGWKQIFILTFVRFCGGQLACETNKIDYGFNWTKWYLKLFCFTQLHQFLAIKLMLCFNWIIWKIGTMKLNQFALLMRKKILEKNVRLPGLLEKMMLSFLIKRKRCCRNITLSDLSLTKFSKGKQFILVGKKICPGVTKVR